MATSSNLDLALANSIKEVYANLDVINYNRTEYTNMDLRAQNLEYELKDLKQKYGQLTLEHNKLKEKMASLMLTARAEIQRKNALIDSMRQELHNNIIRQDTMEDIPAKPCEIVAINRNLNYVKNININRENGSTQNIHQSCGNLLCEGNVKQKCPVKGSVRNRLGRKLSNINKNSNLPIMAKQLHRKKPVNFEVVIERKSANIVAQSHMKTTQKQEWQEVRKVEVIHEDCDVEDREIDCVRLLDPHSESILEGTVLDYNHIPSKSQQCDVILNAVPYVGNKPIGDEFIREVREVPTRLQSATKYGQMKDVLLGLCERPVNEGKCYISTQRSIITDEDKNEGRIEKKLFQLSMLNATSSGGEMDHSRLKPDEKNDESREVKLRKEDNVTQNDLKTNVSRRADRYKRRSIERDRGRMRSRETESRSPVRDRQRLRSRETNHRIPLRDRGRIRSRETERRSAVRRRHRIRSRETDRRSPVRDRQRLRSRETNYRSPLIDRGRMRSREAERRSPVRGRHRIRSRETDRRSPSKDRRRMRSRETERRSPLKDRRRNRETDYRSPLRGGRGSRSREIELRSPVRDRGRNKETKLVSPESDPAQKRRREGDSRSPTIDRGLKRSGEAVSRSIERDQQQRGSRETNCRSPVRDQDRNKENEHNAPDRDPLQNTSRKNESRSPERDQGRHKETEHSSLERDLVQKRRRGTGSRSPERIQERRKSREAESKSSERNQMRKRSRENKRRSPIRNQGRSNETEHSSPERNPVHSRSRKNERSPERVQEQKRSRENRRTSSERDPERRNSRETEIRSHAIDQGRKKSRETESRSPDRNRTRMRSRETNRRMRNSRDRNERGRRQRSSERRSNRGQNTRRDSRERDRHNRTGENNSKFESDIGCRNMKEIGETDENNLKYERRSLDSADTTNVEFFTVDEENYENDDVLNEGFKAEVLKAPSEEQKEQSGIAEAEGQNTLKEEDEEQDEVRCKRKLAEWLAEVIS